MAIGTVEWLVIGTIALVIFGPSQLPKLARALGTTIKEFKKSLKESDSLKELEELDNAIKA